MRFLELCLDIRIVKAITDLGWDELTMVQEGAIPQLLDGKNVIARGRTGSGKTAAFLVPIIHQILSDKCNHVYQKTTVLILTPSKELCNQAAQKFRELTKYCSREVTCLDISADNKIENYRGLLSGNPDVVIGTPARILAHLRAGHFSIKESLKTLVIDEADLLLGYGYGKDMLELRCGATVTTGTVSNSNNEVSLSHDVETTIDTENTASSNKKKSKKSLSGASSGYLPAVFQAVLMSATLQDEVVIKQLRKNLISHATWQVVTPADEPNLPISKQLTQYIIKVDFEEKFVLLLALLQLKLLRGKTLVFVNSVDRCYRAKLFLSKFGYRAVILNAKMPTESRVHVVGEFNSGAYDLLFASDEYGKEMSDDGSTKGGLRPDKIQGSNNTAKEVKTEHGKFKKGDQEYGVSRGVDFRLVANVLNFDFPHSLKSYIHRVGRTARGTQQGNAISFVGHNDEEVCAKIEATLSAACPEQECSLKPFNFRMDQIDGIRYRALDILRSITSTLIRETQRKEIEREMVNCVKLKTYFTENARDLQALKHDLDSTQLNVAHGNSAHLKHLPDYNVPLALRKMMGVGGKNRKPLICVGTAGSKKKKRRSKSLQNSSGKKGKGPGAAIPKKGAFIAKPKTSDPLYRFEAALRNNKQPVKRQGGTLVTKGQSSTKKRRH